MPTEASDETLCRTCGKPRNNHPYRHPFNGFFPGEGSDDASNDAQQAVPSSPRRVGIASGGDLVLRMALLRLGIITTADLERVVDELNASGVSGFEPDNQEGLPGSGDTALG